eukprot:scpid72947/ scgid14246/ Sarcalumenin
MSSRGGSRSRSAANAVENVTMTLNERILRDCHALYVDEEKGLISIAEDLGLTLLAPRKKISVLLIGNHSAGKSSFINWYIDEHVQRTGVAIETQGFTFVTSGKKRESLTGNATLHLYPHFKPLQKLDGVVEYLSTEISPSRQKRFGLVTFVDTPGLVDGDMKYPFNVEETIFWLGNLADLIFVFFDPIGQALCKRTLNVVERLNDTHSDRIRFYLTKADTAGDEKDRQRVLMQIVQELCKRPGLNKCGFDMPTIYVPSLIPKPARCENQLEQVCVDIDKTINQTIQNTLNTLEKDCETIARLTAEKLEKDRQDRSYNLRARSKGVLFGLLGFMLPLVLLVHFLASESSNVFMAKLADDDIVNLIRTYLSPVAGFWQFVPTDYHTFALGGLAFLSILLLILARFASRTRPTLSSKVKRRLQEKSDFVDGHVKATKKQLYSDYLKQSVGAVDLS